MKAKKQRTTIRRMVVSGLALMEFLEALQAFNNLADAVRENRSGDIRTRVELLEIDHFKGRPAITLLRKIIEDPKTSDA